MKTRFLATGLLLVFLLSGFSSVLVSAQTATPTTQTTGRTTTFVNLRTGAGLNFTIITVVPPDTTVNILGRNEAGDWLRVNVDQLQGWMSRPLVNFGGVALAELPVVTGTTTAAPTGNTASATAVPSEANADGSTAAPTATGQTLGGRAVSKDERGVYDIAVGTRFGGADGRLNPFTYLGEFVFYCIDGNGYTDVGTYSNGGGIVINRWGGGLTGVVLFASEALINSVGVPAEPTIIISEGGFTLSRLPDGRFRMTGLNIHGEAFTFLWRNCNAGPAFN